MNSPTNKPPNQTPEFESDNRIPSGEWSGFYMESHQPRRGWMHLYINFHDAQIQGEGTDYVGPWVIQGSYDTKNGVCQWTKQYQGKHKVSYEGKITENGIQGVWKIRNWNQGPFHIWPSSRLDLQNLYMKDEMESDKAKADSGGSIMFRSGDIRPEDIA